VSRARRRLGSIRDFHVSAYRYYRKHQARHALHPLSILVGTGLTASLAVRSIQILWSPRPPRQDGSSPAPRGTRRSSSR
jgi:hypothetical protein